MLSTKSICQTVNFKIDTRQSKAIYNIINLNKKGLIFFRNTVSDKKGINNAGFYNTTLLDTNLNEIWTQTISIPNHYSLKGYVTNNEKCHYVFTNKKNILIISQLIQNGTLNSTTTSLNQNINISNIKLLDQQLIIAGSQPPSNQKYILSSIATVVFFPLIFVPGFIPQPKDVIYNISIKGNYPNIKFETNPKVNSEITDIDIDTTEKKIYIVNNLNYKKQKGVSLVSYKENGKQIKLLNLKSIFPTINPYNTKIIVDTDYQFLTGLFNIKSNSPSGVFWNKIENGISVSQKTLYFNKIPDFFNYIKVKDQLQYNKNIDYNGSCTISNFLMDENQNTLIVLEFYRAEYHTESRIVYINGLPTTSFIQVFDGYNYTHGISWELDQFGNTLSTNYYPIKDVRTKFINTKLNATYYQRQINIGYISNNKIQYAENKIIQPENPSYYYTKPNDEINYQASKQAKNINFKTFYNNKIIEFGIDGEDDSIFEKGNAQYFIRIKN